MIAKPKRTLTPITGVAVGEPTRLSRFARSLLPYLVAVMPKVEPPPLPEAEPDYSHEPEDDETWFLAPGQRWRIERLQTPPWANRSAIRAIYEEARRVTAETGQPHHVDHDYPLRGTFVSGLHVETNLVVMPALSNLSKGNRFTP